MAARFVLLLTALCCAMGFQAPAWAAGQPVDLALVLAVDASGSVDDGEYALQLSGIAAGFRDPVVQDAIKSASGGPIAVTLMVWADHRVPKDKTGWFLLTGADDAEAFARAVESFPRNQNGGTGIGEGIAAALRIIETSNLAARRKVIDISGDGRETAPRDYVVLLPQARVMANAFGVTINCLAITNEDPNLLSYFTSEVRTGQGSFAMSATDYGDFADAMRRKLLREIENRPKVSQR
jgi:Protein of unknown function (DUF1194)